MLVPSHTLVPPPANGSPGVRYETIMTSTAARPFNTTHASALEPHRLTLASGLSLEYVDHGHADGVPVVLLHGVTDSWRSFEPLLPHLPPRIRAIAVSQRGHGGSDKPATGYRAADFARDVAELLDALGVPSAFVAGHSMGATHAARVALDYPGRVRGLVLLGAFASYRHCPEILDFHAGVVSSLSDPVPDELVREFQQSTLAQPVPPAYFETVVAESLKVPAHVWRQTFEALLDDECAAEWDAIAAPTLLLWGARDAFSRLVQQYALLEAIADTRFITYERAGHALHWEEPLQVAADIVAFTEGRQAGTRTR